MSVKLHICGARGSYPSYGESFKLYGKETCCYVIRENDYAIVLDCGSGLSKAKEILKGCKRVDVLFSHLHYDHVMGLFETPNFAGDAEVHFYGFFMEWMATEKKEDSFIKVEEYLKGEMHSVYMNELTYLSDGYSALFSNANHGDNSAMIKIIKNDLIVCYTGDNEHDYKDKTYSWARNASVLISEGTYTFEEKIKYKGRGHSSWSDGVDIAMKSNVKKLIIVHHGNNHSDEVILEQEKQAKNIYPDIIFAHEGDSWTIH